MEESTTSDRSCVAVVIVNYNGGSLLHRCLDALACQVYDRFVTIVVDNASTDGSVEGIERRYAGVRVIRSSINLGFAAGTNLGVAAAVGCEWIACLNPDAFPDPDWLANLVGVAEKSAGYSFFGSRMVQANDSSVLDGTGDIYHVSGSAWRRDYRRPAKAGVAESGEIFSPCAAAALYRRTAILEVGGFDESYFCYFEDVDLGFRLRLRGHRCLYVPGAVVHHVGSAIAGERSDFTLYHGQRNLIWVYFKNMPALFFWLYLPQHVLLNLVSLVWFSLRGQARTVLKAKWDALKGLPRVLRERRRVQRSRRVDIWEVRRTMTKGVLVPYLRVRS